MATKTEIANMALVGLGAETVSDISTDSNESARKLRAIWNTTLKAVLRSHPWGFAKKETALSQITTSPVLTDDYTYIYNLPSDFVKLTKTDVEPTYSHKIKGRKLYSKSDSVKIEYIYFCEDTSLYDDCFVDAFAGRLAAEIAYSITGDLNVSQLKWQEATQKLRLAKSMAGQEVTPDEPDQDEFINARI